MPTETERSPTYTNHAETLLGTRAFYDDEREDKLRNGTLKFTAESAGMRGLLYVQTLRLLAQAVGERDLEERRSNALRPSRLGKFALEHLPEIIEISRQMAVINNAERMLDEQEDVFLGGLRVHQQPYMRDIVAFMNTGPQKLELAPEMGLTDDIYMRGALVEAPTGLGKTVLMARALVALGVGKPLESVEHNKDRVRALIIVPSQTIVQQMTGKVGDDTLRKFAPGIDVGGFYQHEKDAEADAVTITIDQFVENFRDGMLFGQRFDVCIIDEAHTATQPQLQKTLLEEWRGGPIIGFTATPEYSQNKDARKLLPHRIFHGDLLDFIQSEEDVLNAVQLYQIRVEYEKYITPEVLSHYEGMSKKQLEQMMLREATAESLEPLIAQGRRGILFCEQGGEEPSGYAKRMAERLRMLTKPDGSPLQVAVAGTINNSKPLSDPGSNMGIRKRYAAGELDFIVTVDWGREGLNEDIDIVGTIGKITSRHKFLQEIGRGTRLSKRFPVTTLLHIHPPLADFKALSLFGIFGFEEIEQGVLIGRKKPSEDSKNAPGPSHSETPDRARNSKVTIADFPLRIQELVRAMHMKTVGEALFDNESYTHVPKEYVTFDDITEDVAGPKATLRRHLREKMGFRAIGRYEKAPDGRAFVFYFEPAAGEYLAQFRNAVARVDLQREFGGVDVTIVDALAEETQATPFKWFYYDGKFIPHYKPDDANKIRRVYDSTPPANPSDYTRLRLAQEAGIQGRGILGRLLPAEIGAIVRKRTVTSSGKIRVLDHWEEKDAHAIITRLREIGEYEGVPLYLLSRELALRFIDTSREALAGFAEEIGFPGEIARVARSGRPPMCFTWATIRRAIEEFGMSAPIHIDFSRLPAGFSDKDHARRTYAEQLIAQITTLPPHYSTRTYEKRTRK